MSADVGFEKQTQWIAIRESKVTREREREGRDQTRTMVRKKRAQLMRMRLWYPWWNQCCGGQTGSLCLWLCVCVCQQNYSYFNLIVINQKCLHTMFQHWRNYMNWSNGGAIRQDLLDSKCFLSGFQHYLRIWMKLFLPSDGIAFLFYYWAAYMSKLAYRGAFLIKKDTFITHSSINTHVKMSWIPVVCNFIKLILWADINLFPNPVCSDICRFCAIFTSHLMAPVKDPSFKLTY